MYNFIGLPFAMGFGLMLPKPVMLPPMAAGAAMAASSTSVVCSSLLLKFWKRPRWMNVERLEAEGSRKEDLKGMKTTYQGSLIEKIVPSGLRRVVWQASGRRRTLDEGYVPLQDVEAV